MAVITISRLVGSKGTAIGKEVAKRIDYHYIDINLVQKIMNQYGEINFRNIYNSKIATVLNSSATLVILYKEVQYESKSNTYY